MRPLLLIAVCLLFSLGFAQHRKGQFRLANPHDAHVLYVAFAEDNWNVSGLQAEYGFGLEKALPVSDAKIEALAYSSKDSGRAANRLKRIYKVITSASNPKLLEIASKLEALPEVAYCELSCKKPVPPPADIPPATPNYFSHQGYIQQNPGVDMQFAWNLGLNGSGIRMRDVEYGFNKNHEEFADNPDVFMQAGAVLHPNVSQEYTEHGTAVFGIVAANDGSYGVTGMAHGLAEMIQFPEWTVSGYNPAAAVSEAIEVSEQGDIIMLEMQEYGVNDQFVPAEYSQIIWDLTQAATQAGIHVISAAGNGNANLDGAFYSAYMSRGDSGAIIVGAGTPDLQHDKISYSTYGSRVNVQAWASNVRSSGYGNFSAIAGDFNQTYCTFSGTSSATPIVASCVAVLQSYYHGLSGEYLSPSEMRQLLIETGIAQGSGGHIGPIPDMQSAIETINSLAVRKFEALVFSVYPNPAQTKVWLHGDFSESTSVEIANALGQSVLRSRVREMDISHLEAGVYFVKVSDGNRVGTKRLVKVN